MLRKLRDRNHDMYFRLSFMLFFLNKSQNLRREWKETETDKAEIYLFLHILKDHTVSLSNIYFQVVKEVLSTWYQEHLEASRDPENHFTILSNVSRYISIVKYP